MSLSAQHWQERLDALRAKHGIVGASLAVAQGSDTVTAASGALNLRTGQPVAADSLFQIGSITKIWTATLIMQLVDEGLLDLDAPVIQYLPDFRIADEEITRTVTTRQLLSHTSGIDGDLFLDTGRGDDALAKYVDAMASLTRAVPPGKVMSYCNSGYNLLGHLIATLRGKSWDEVLQERLLKPLGLSSAGTLPEEALLYGAATGHLQAPGAAAPTVTPRWGMPRSAGPAGLIHSSAEQQLALARLHMNRGVAPDGTRLLSEASAQAMLVPQIEVPDRWVLGTHWGLGWILGAWGDQPVYGHDGATLGQAAFLRVLPGRDLAISLLTNGGKAARALYHELFSEIATALAGVAPPLLPQPDEAAPFDPARFVGRYQREGLEIVVAEKEGKLSMMQNPSGLLAVVMPKAQFTLVPHGGDVMVMFLNGQNLTTPVVFFDLEGQRYIHFGARTMARTGL